LKLSDKTLKKIKPIKFDNYYNFMELLKILRFDDEWRRV